MSVFGEPWVDSQKQHTIHTVCSEKVDLAHSACENRQQRDVGSAILGFSLLTASRMKHNRSGFSVPNLCSVGHNLCITRVMRSNMNKGQGLDFLLGEQIYSNLGAAALISDSSGHTNSGTQECLWILERSLMPYWLLACVGGGGRGLGKPQSSLVVRGWGLSYTGEGDVLLLLWDHWWSSLQSCRLKVIYCLLIFSFSPFDRFRSAHETEKKQQSRQIIAHTCSHRVNWTWTRLSVCLIWTIHANASKYSASRAEVSSYPALAHTQTHTLTKVTRGHSNLESILSIPNGAPC